MRFFAVVAAVAATAVSALTINTPTSLIVCQPALLSWGNGTAPYYVSVIPGGDASGTALKSFDDTSDTSLTWTVDIAAGTSVTIKVTDSTGTINYSDQVTIQSGSSTSCLTSSSGSASSGSSASATGAAVSSATATASAAAGSASGSASRAASSAGSATAAASGASGSASRAASASGSGASSAASGAASASASPSSAATANKIPFTGLVGALVGVVGALAL